VQFKPIKPQKIAEQVAAVLRDTIINGTYRAGQTLPSERDLATQFEVNRSSIREAILRLEAWGLVDIRQGGGTMVRDVTSAGLQVLPFLLAPNGELDAKWLMDLLQVRVLMLSWTASKAAENAKPEHVERLRAALESLSAATTAEELQLADYEFFEGMVSAADNRVIALIANAVREVYLENKALFLGLYAFNFELKDHEKAFAAIETGDGEAARVAMDSYGRRALGGGVA